MSAAAAILPYVWAFAPARPLRPEPAALPEPRIQRPVHLLRERLAFYRKYTEALLRRYLRLSMEAGKVPSLVGQEILRSHATSCRVEGFDDAVIFRHDVDHCLERLDTLEQRLVRHLAIEQYTVNETAAATGLNQRTVIRRYNLALDRLTEIFLQVKMLEPQKFCQEE